MTAEFDKIKNGHILQAINLFDEGGYPRSRKTSEYDMIYNEIFKQTQNLTKDQYR